MGCFSWEGTLISPLLSFISFFSHLFFRISTHISLFLIYLFCHTSRTSALSFLHSLCLSLSGWFSPKPRGLHTTASAAAENAHMQESLHHSWSPLACQALARPCQRKRSHAPARCRAHDTGHCSEMKDLAVGSFRFGNTDPLLAPSNCLPAVAVLTTIHHICP